VGLKRGPGEINRDVVSGRVALAHTSAHRVDVLLNRIQAVVSQSQNGLNERLCLFFHVHVPLRQPLAQLASVVEYEERAKHDRHRRVHGDKKLKSDCPGCPLKHFLA
jgi:hypothetical protein